MRLGELLARFSGKRAVVVGDLMLDEYIFGHATRISPEAPVMVVRQKSSQSVPGGAANVARNLAAMGAQVTLLGVIGDDAAGETLDRSLRDYGVGRAILFRDSSRPTTRKTRVLADSAHQVLRIDHEEERPISSAIEGRLIDSVKDSLRQCDVLVMSDYLKGALTAAVTASALTETRASGLPSVVNPKPASLALYRGASLLSLNRREANDAIGSEGLDGEDYIRRAGELSERFGVDYTLITLGDEGMVVSSEDGEGLQVRAPRVEVYDTAGAGDTVVAAVALGLCSGGFAREVFEVAARAAASVVRKVGVATPSAEDLEAIGEVESEEGYPVPL